MGKRYQAILRHLGKDFVGIDKGDELPEIPYSGYIIATPTDTHAGFLAELVKYKKPILCEKPISKNMDEVGQLMRLYHEEKCPLKMMLQYDYVAEFVGNGLSLYNYFRHGNDGLVWDCMQIVGAAKGEIALYDDSPIWKCSINGRDLNSAQMDYAYVRYVQDWFKDPFQPLGRIMDIHQKTDAEARSGRHG